ncbi:MAG: type II secretion system minor pseudopilin GspJ [Halopseudomonas sp.]|uniref:type II secretion system minor pseudopilin GspJ n=1 Tax=Halopseudomonas sp. TaxID=2901191 RepID=UPI003002E5F1
MSSTQRGFTLLELLIAMAVFAIMSVVAYSGLRAVLDADHITRASSGQLADLQVSLSVLERDLAQMVDIQVRDEFGDRLPPLRLLASNEQPLLEIVRAGAGGDQRLRRTAWRITETGLERELWPGVDITDPEQLRVQPFADLVEEDERLGVETGFAFVVRGPSGLERATSWPPEGLDPSSSQLPLAVEVTLDVPRLGLIRRLIAVGVQ